MRDHDATTQADGRNFISSSAIQTCAQTTAWRGHELSASCQLSSCMYGATGVSWRVRQKGGFCCENSQCSPRQLQLEDSSMFRLQRHGMFLHLFLPDVAVVSGHGRELPGAVSSCHVSGQAGRWRPDDVHVESCHRPVRHLRGLVFQLEWRTQRSQIKTIMLPTIQGYEIWVSILCNSNNKSLFFRGFCNDTEDGY